MSNLQTPTAPRVISMDGFRSSVKEGGGKFLTDNAGPHIVTTGAFTPKIAVKKGPNGRKQVSFIISTAGLDRDGDTIQPDGWVLDNYRKNPVILWAHDYSLPPIGKSVRTVIENGNLVADAEFVPPEIDGGFGRMVEQMLEEGFLNAASVGFMPIDYERLADDPDGWGLNFLEQELWEWSVVPVPSNPEALARAKSAGIDTGPMVQWAERVLDGEVKTALPIITIRKAYAAAQGDAKVHKLTPSEQEALAKKNIEQVKAQKGEDSSEDMSQDTSKDTAPATKEIRKTQAAGDDNHVHEYEDTTAGVTEPAGDPEHVHAVSLNDDGTVTIEEAEDHGHEAAPENQQPKSEEEIEQMLEEQTEDDDDAGVEGADDDDDDEARDVSADDKEGDNCVKVDATSILSALNSLKDQIDTLGSRLDGIEGKEAPEQDETPIKVVRIAKAKTVSVSMKALDETVSEAIRSSITDAVSKAVRTKMNQLTGRLD